VDNERGFDHEMSVPLKVMYPEAKIPTVQVSLVSRLEPEKRLRLGRALRCMKKRNLLFLGSEFSFHNLRGFFSSGRSKPDPRNAAFQHWLVETCTSPGSSQSDREKRLIEWESAPSARYFHPREQHLIPLHVCCGLAGPTGRLAFDGEVHGKRAISVFWEI